MLNDHPIVHESLQSSAIAGESMTNEIAVPQIDNSGRPALGSSDPRPFAYRWQRNVATASDGTDAQIVVVDLHIVSLANQQVNTDDLSLRILRDEEGSLRIADVVKVPQNGPAHKEAVEDEEAKDFTILPISNGANLPASMGRNGVRQGNLCKVKAMLAAKAQAIKQFVEATRARAGAMSHHGRPCPKKTQSAQDHTPVAPPPGVIPIKGGVAKFWAWKINPEEKPSKPEDQEASRRQGEEQEKGHQPIHGHHRGDYRRNCRMMQVARVFHHFLTGFVLPILVGVAAGMTASLLGMIVSTALAMLWFMIARRGRRGNASVRDEPAAEQANADEAAMEKKGLMEPEGDGEESEAEQRPAYRESE